MKARRLLTFVLCFVMLVASFAVIASANGAETTTPFTEVTNSDGSVTGKYGTIPSAYANATTYPFVLFKYKNGALNGASVGYKTMKDALNNARGYQDDNTWDRENKVYTGDIYTSKIILRRDYTTTTSDKFDNYAQTMNETVLDLNGYTLTQGAGTEALFYRVTSKPWGNPETGNRGVFETEITVINGEIAVTDNPVFCGNVWNCLYYDKNGNAVTTIYNSSKTKIDGAKLMQDENGKYYYVDKNNGNAVIEKVYDANGVEIDVNGIHLSSVISMADKDFIWNFDNVKFKYASGATETSMMMNYAAIQGADVTPSVVAAPFYFNFNNCTFDLSTNAPSGNITLFNAAPTAAQWIKTTVTVEGCEIVAPLNRTSKLVVYKTESVNGSSVNFVNDANGNALTWTLPEGETPYVPTTTTHMTMNGNKLYWHKTEGNTYAFTECVTGEHTCSCGAIFTDCVDENADNVCDLCDATKIGGTWIADESEAQYPFAVLDASGAYSSLQTTWKNATTAAAKIDGSTIVLRRNYTNVASDTNNLKAMETEFTVDLNGYTLTRGYNGAYLFDNWWDSATTAGTVTVNFKNGTLNAEKWLICLSGNNAIANEKTANFVFDNVNFKFASNNDKTDGWIFVVHSQAYNKTITANITFNDCSFDTTDMRSSIAMDKAPALNLDVNNSSGTDYVKCNVTFNGGKIIANRFETAALYQTHADDVVTFAKGSDDSYLTLEMADGTTPNTPAAADYFTIDGKNVYFHKNGDVYTLTECLDPATNHECTCGFFYSECSDADKNHICDVCGQTSDCLDENLDHVCEICGETTPCEDENKDHNCDTCTKVLSECSDEDKNHVCDWCTKTISVCADEDNNGQCDVCGLYKYDLGKYGIFWNATNYSVSTYPFFVLKYQDGVYTFASACKTFYGSQSGSSAMGYSIYSVLRDNNRYDLETGEYVSQVEGKGVVTAVVVMRRDYDLQSGTESHNNMAHMQGTTILDLGGYTLREAEGSTKSLLYITAKGWTGNPDKNNGYNDFTFPSTLDVVNGRMEVRKYAAATIGTSDAVEVEAGFYIKNSVYTINFNGVTFGLTEGATTTSLVYSNGSAGNAYSGVAKVNVNVNNCVFDLKTNAITNAITLINNTNWKEQTNNKTIYYGTDVDCDVLINGGEILATSVTNVTVYKTAATNGSSTLVQKGEGGKYITLTMPKGSVAPLVSNTTVVDSGVVCAFVKTSEDAENVNYGLYPAVMVGYKIKTSVTLWSNFVYNIYIPKANVNSFTVNGSEAEYVETEIDGVAYYHVAVNLPAGEALSDIALTVTFNSGETTTSANWTLSTLKYTKAVLAGEYNDVTKTLMKDMLVYAAAAHTYFENTEKVSAKLSEVATILDGYTKVLPEGSEKKPTDKTYFTDVTVYLGEVPSFRFTLAEGYTADNFTFTVGERNATVIAGDGYVEIVMYAYMMLDDVTFTVNETEVSESYNLYSYYAYAKTLGDANLTAIVEALMKYSVAANEYRDYVVENTCYHNYVDGVCTKCGGNDPDVGTMTLTAPSAIYSNYPGKDISVTFSKDWYKGEVTFTTNNENVFIENGKIFAKGSYDKFPWETPTPVTVTATTADHTAIVTVNVSTYRSTNVNVESKLEYYENNIIKDENKGGVIFLGDSYFDGAQPLPPFWRDFYTDWADEKAFLMGMSSSKIEELEVASERIVYPMNPSEIVIHIGHNDMHSGTISPEDFVTRLTALVSEYHEKLPETKIYVLSVDPKRDSADPTNARHESSFVKVPAVNAAMKTFAEGKDWITYVDTTDIFYTKNVQGELTAINTNMYPSSDASHPTLVAYDLMRIKINEARGKALDNVIDINNADKSYSIGTAGKTYSINGDFALSGRLVITQFVKANAHLQFSFVATSGRPDRFILWDGNSDGNFGIGYEEGGKYTNETSAALNFSASNGLIINWTVIVKESKAYFFIGGKLQKVFENPQITNKFNIDATGIDVTLYDIDFIEKSVNADEYNAFVTPYFAENVANIEMYGQNGNITDNGKTFTDASGNALTNNYIIKGKLNIKDFGKSNPHIQFLLGSNYRFLLWDSTRDGKFGAGYTENGTNVSDTGAVTLYDANGGLILDWAVVVNEGKAYWFINGKLEKTFASPNLQTFNLGALQTDAYFYDIELFVKSENATAYEEEFENYFSYSFEINNFDGTAASTISATGPTYTQDTYGNALAGSNYVISGSLTITKMNMNANMHMQFYFCNGYRFLIWDQAGNGKFGAGYQENGTHKNDTQVGEKYDGTSGTLTLDWAVIVKDGMAYWFINDELVKTFTEPSEGAFGSINIGATKMEVSVYDVLIYAENGSSAEYNATVAKYEI